MCLWLCSQYTCQETKADVCSQQCKKINIKILSERAGELKLTTPLPKNHRFAQPARPCLYPNLDSVSPIRAHDATAQDRGLGDTVFLQTIIFARSIMLA